MTIKKAYDKGSQFLHTTSSATKIWNQLMMFFILGILPLIFPQWIYLKNRESIFINLILALVTSIIYELWLRKLRKNNQNPRLVIKLQLFTSVVLLTWFLHVLGRINGPFFPIYLITIMESFLNRNISFSNFIVSIMVVSLTLEFFWLILQKEIVLTFVSGLEFFFRIICVVFIRTYGFVLAKKIDSEQLAKERAKKATEKMSFLAERLRKTNADLKEVSALKDEFVSLTSHELRTPLTAIGGSLATVLEGYAGKVNEKTREFLKGAFSENNRLLRLVNNLLNISRIEAGRLKFNILPLNLNEVVRAVLETLKTQAEEKKLKLVFDPQENLVVQADEDKLREIIINLCGNAFKFTEVGGVFITAWCQEDMAIVAVEDTGRGILPQDQQKLFRKFAQADSIKNAKKKGGTGLGLYICKNLIEGMGGEIWLQSEHNKGSTFYFTLPLK